jgi:enediyne biosynthesis protein E3
MTMTLSLSRVRRAVMGVSDAEATAFSRGDTPTWKHLETVVRTAVGGYHEVLDGSRFQDLIPRLDQTPLEFRGYAYEGAAMGLTGLDCFLPGSSRFQAYLEGPGRPHIYMVHIGAGEALARLRRKPEPFMRRLADPALRWLVMDGYGFHEGFFKSRRFVAGQQVPVHLSAFGRRVFDQGVGRSIWFTSGADACEISRTIAAFPAHRHADLWVGIGVACGYVGGVDRITVEALRAAAGRHATRMAVGTAFVAKGRLRAGNPIPDTELACDVLCGVSGEEAARLVDQAFEDLPDTRSQPAYDTLQRRLETSLSAAATTGEPA